MAGQALYSQIPDRRLLISVAVYHQGVYVTTIRRDVFRLMGHGDLAYVRHQNKWRPLYRDDDGDYYVGDKKS